jgi:hypothetical protein
MGVATSAWDARKRLGDDAFSWSLILYDQHTKSEFTGLRHDGKSLPYHNVFSKGTRVGALLDLDVGTLEYVVDGIKKGKKKTYFMITNFISFSYGLDRCSF